jgi:hypothetical protein
VLLSVEDSVGEALYPSVFERLIYSFCFTFFSAFHFS